MLLDNGAIDVDGKALVAASVKGHEIRVLMLLDKHIKYYIQHSDALNLAMGMASENGHDEVVRACRSFRALSNNTMSLRTEVFATLREIAVHQTAQRIFSHLDSGCPILGPAWRPVLGGLVLGLELRRGRWKARLGTLRGGRYCNGWLLH